MLFLSLITLHSPEDSESSIGALGLVDPADLNLLASLPQAPIPPHEFVSLAECYADQPQQANPATSAVAALTGLPQPPIQAVQPPVPSMEDTSVDLVKHGSGGPGNPVNSPEYISL